MSGEELTSQKRIESAKCNARKQAVSILFTLVHASSVEHVERIHKCKVTGYEQSEHRSIILNILASLDTFVTGNGFFLSWRGSGELDDYTVFASMDKGILTKLRICGPETYICFENVLEEILVGGVDSEGTIKTDLPRPLEHIGVSILDSVLPTEVLWIPGLTSGNYNRRLAGDTTDARRARFSGEFDLVPAVRDSKPRYNRAEAKREAMLVIAEGLAEWNRDGREAPLEP